MKRIALLLFTIAGLSAADAMTVDPSGKVGIGTATPTSTLDVAGTATATNVIVNRATQATATEAVRGDDPRMANARPANGGNAATVGGLAPSAFVATTQKGAANGVATLDSSGKIPGVQLPTLGPSHDIIYISTSGNFTVPEGVTRIFVKVWGGGGGGGTGGGGNGGNLGPLNYSNGGGAGGFAFAKVSVTPGQIIPVTVGNGGWNGAGNTVPTDGQGSSFGSFASASGGYNGWSATILGGGGSGLIGDSKLTGGSGGGSNLGIGGASSFGGSGGMYGGNPASGANGQVPGGGGSSGFGSTTMRGGLGGNGLVIVEW